MDQLCIGGEQMLQPWPSCSEEASAGCHAVCGRDLSDVQPEELHANELRASPCAQGFVMKRSCRLPVKRDSRGSKSITKLREPMFNAPQFAVRMTMRRFLL